MLYSFFICEFLLEGFSHKFFNEATYIMQLTNVMYSFLQEPFFPLSFRMEFLMRHLHIVVIGQGGCCKIYGLYPRRKGEGIILILVYLYVGSYQTLRPW
jgi:hypothetical protein